MGPVSLDHQIAAVVNAGNCSGCGACCLLDRGLRMELSDLGYARPVRHGAAGKGAASVDFDRVCPGATVSASKPVGAKRHPEMGSSFGSWQAWAADPALRFAGSSGGVISALASWLLKSGRAAEVVEASKSPDDPRRTVALTLRTPDGILQGAGSRYAPVSNAEKAVLGRADAVFVGKPCEVASVRALSREAKLDPPLLVTFFCAGTPSQAATDALAEQLAPGKRIVDLWYRGRGWPGSFTIVTEDASTASMSYDDSWGRQLGPSMQWRCKICPDGVGESADIVAADYWEADASGYPLFDEADGVSALIARTPRGHAVIQDALDAGVLRASAITLGNIAKVQPFQVLRRRSLLARLLGTWLAGRPVPRYRGFGLIGLSARYPKGFLQTAWGSFRRARAGKVRH